MIHILIALLFLLPLPQSTEHKVTYYWAAENDGWGNLVADPACPDPPDESWGWNWCAVSPDLMWDYPYGTVLFVFGEGFKCVHDRTAGWVRDTIDLRVPDRKMERHYRKVWVVWKPLELLEDELRMEDIEYEIRDGKLWYQFKDGDWREYEDRDCLPKMIFPLGSWDETLKPILLD